MSIFINNIMRFKQYFLEETLDEGLLNSLQKPMWTILGSIFSVISLPLSAQAKESLKDQIGRHEGLSVKAYTDSVGKRTIGIGFNLDDNKELAKRLFSQWKLDYNKVYSGDVSLSSEQVQKLFELSLPIAVSVAKKFVKNFDQQPEEIKEVLINMSFNLGNRLHQFEKTKEYLEAKDYKNASKEMLKSKWATQVGKRATELSAIVAKQAAKPKPTTSSVGPAPRQSSSGPVR